MLNLITLFVVTAVAFGLVISLMAVGVMLGRREIKGSCGGLGASQGEGESSSCSLCSKPDAACRELGRGQGERRTGGAGGARSVDEATACDQNCEDNGCSEEEIEACNKS
jgi:hypothetical protein